MSQLPTPSPLESGGKPASQEGDADGVAGSTPGNPSQSEAVKSATPRLVAGFVLVFVCLIVFGSLAEGVRSQEVFALDQLATPFLHGFASPALDTIMQAATNVGSNLTIVPLFLVAGTLLLVRRRLRESAFLAVAVGGSLALNGVMKLLFQRPRPPLPWAQILPDYSFPSGHSMNSFVFYLALAVLVWRFWGRRPGILATAAALSLILLIGASRIYLGYHYLTDVLGGYTAGFLWFAIAAAVIEGGRRARRPWSRDGGQAQPS